MNGLARLGQVILVVLNILFVIIGLALFIVACIVKYGSDLLDPYLRPVYEAIGKILLEQNDGEIGLGNFDLGQVVGDIAIMVIIVGVIMFVTGFMGCCGACCKVRCMLVVYFIVLILVIIVEVVLIIIAFTLKDQIVKSITDPLSELITDYYSGFSGIDAITFECCGVFNFNDFTNTTEIWSDVTINNRSYLLATPIACCKLNGTFPDVTPPSDYDCAVNPTVSNSNYQTGCFQTIEDILVAEGPYLIGFGVLILVFELLMVVFSIMLCKSVGSKNKVI